jgi:hypothetical protein
MASACRQQRSASEVGHLKCGLQGEAEELRAKLVDSRQQVQGHEQMIRWLNNQVLCAAQHNLICFSVSACMR